MRAQKSEGESRAPFSSPYRPSSSARFKFMFHLGNIKVKFSSKGIAMIRERPEVMATRKASYQGPHTRSQLLRNRRQLVSSSVSVLSSRWAALGQLPQRMVVRWCQRRKGKVGKTISLAQGPQV